MVIQCGHSLILSEVLCELCYLFMLIYYSANVRPIVCFLLIGRHTCDVECCFTIIVNLIHMVSLPICLNFLGTMAVQYGEIIIIIFCIEFISSCFLKLSF